MPKSMKPGGGGKFQALSSKLAKEPGISNPDALAASIGRQKYGNEKFQAMGQHGTNFAQALKQK